MFDTANDLSPRLLKNSFKVVPVHGRDRASIPRPTPQCSWYPSSKLDLTSSLTYSWVRAGSCPHPVCLGTLTRSCNPAHPSYSLELLPQGEADSKRFISDNRVRPTQCKVSVSFPDNSWFRDPARTTHIIDPDRHNWSSLLSFHKNIALLLSPKDKINSQIWLFTTYYIAQFLSHLNFLFLQSEN